MADLTSANGSPGPQSRSLRVAFAVPVIVFSTLALVLAWGLGRNADELPSVLIDKPVPEFQLPPVQGRSLGLSSVDLRGGVSLVNVFASWCTPCRAEHPLLLQLAKTGAVPIHGINHKDRPADAARWLDMLGDPYTRTGADIDGRVAIDWGVYGIPETFVVNAEGRILYRHVGPITQAVLAEEIMSLVRRSEQ